MFEQVIFSRDPNKVEARMLDDKVDRVGEFCSYKADKAGIMYEMFLYKNPGWKKYIRKKCHGWGVDTMNELMKKEKQLFGYTPI